MSESAWKRLRRGALWLLFSAVLLIPKVLGLRRRRRAWNAARLVASSLAAALVAASVIGHAPVWVAIVGAVLLAFALATPPERRRPSVDARAKELGAAVVVQGGAYRGAGAAASARDTRLFVGFERLCVLDSSLRLLAEIPLAQLTVLRAEPEGSAWNLHMVWGDSSAEFSFEGPFAEHFARVAESTVRGQMTKTLPILR